ncbi:hypothetical protein AKJ09_02123 [Labilithrix luteola]|uniref:Uncharacterized protein n=1 Tax=Labilithrix luteola TaxID=1391654 RepID=A0A0K1PQR3_9BACT|nr:hypothetical protein AKJ09_02123 [Labilithrix luteola]
MGPGRVGHGDLVGPARPQKGSQVIRERAFVALLDVGTEGDKLGKKRDRITHDVVPIIPPTGGRPHRRARGARVPQKGTRVSSRRTSRSQLKT